MPVFQLTEELLFPPPQLAREDGLLAVGGDLAPERLLQAYKMGIFPWFSKDDPILWWAPDPRLVLFPDELKVSKRLARTIRQGRFTITHDTSFQQVIKACAHVRLKNGEETWLTDEMMEAYYTLHKMGYAHSVECWQNDILAGGLYGIALGCVFFGESMFSKETDSSKVALVHLVDMLKKWGYDIIDCQVRTSHLIGLGAREIAGDDFLVLLRDSIAKPCAGSAWK